MGGASLVWPALSIDESNELYVRHSAKRVELSRI